MGQTFSHREAGITLIELLVVLVIIGLAASAVTLALPGGQTILRRDAEALAARLDTARNAAIINNGDVRARFDHVGYSFETRFADADDWRPAQGVLSPRHWSAGVAAEPEIEGGEAIYFDSTGMGTPGRIVLIYEGLRRVVTVNMGGGVHIDRKGQ